MIALFGAMFTAIKQAIACSFATVPNWLDNGGIAIVKTPEFFWEDEIRKIAAPFKPTETRSEPQLAASPIGSAELAAYSKGAEAFHQGKEHYGKARKHWQALLDLPPQERRGRSVWAAFMLGKLDLYERKPEAVTWFQMTRNLASQGFSDELHLAEDSYGWEAKSELEQGHYEKSAPLYLTQLALGQDSAIVSLKYLVGEIPPPDEPHLTLPGPANIDIEKENKATAAVSESPVTVAPDMDRAARDPLLRKITSAYILASEGGEVSGYRFNKPWNSGHDSPWLKAIERANLIQVDNADELGWIAYCAGRYKEAEHWLKLAPTDSAISLWLKAKLLRRNGDIKGAAKLMAQVVRLIRSEAPAPPTSQESTSVYRFIDSREGMPDQLYSASGDLGALHLSRGDFLSAFDAFYSGDLWDDAAYIADHILTADELKTYVDSHVHWTAEDETKAANQEHIYAEAFPAGFDLRQLLGRHLVRDHRYREARLYLGPRARASLDQYASALSKAADEKLPKTERADAFYSAAKLAYSEGMELMSANDERFRLDISYGRGYFYNTAIERETGKRFEVVEKGGKSFFVPQPLHLYIPVTPREKKRLIQHKLSSGKPYHYRYTAAALAWKASLLFPNDTPELASVLNTAGLWIQDDEVAADKFFQAIERRAHNTELGQLANKKHWFVHPSGP